MNPLWFLSGVNRPVIISPLIDSAGNVNGTFTKIEHLPYRLKMLHTDSPSTMVLLIALILYVPGSR